MFKILGASPAGGVAIGIAVLVFGLLAGRVPLAVVGGFVVLASALRWMNPPSGGDETPPRG